MQLFIHCYTEELGKKDRQLTSKVQFTMKESWKSKKMLKNEASIKASNIKPK